MAAGQGAESDDERDREGDGPEELFGPGAVPEAYEVGEGGPEIAGGETRETEGRYGRDTLQDRGRRGVSGGEERVLHGRECPKSAME